MKNLLFSLLCIILIFINSLNAQNFPKKSWQRNKTPTFSGWNQTKLDNLYEYIVDSTSATGMMIIHDGKVIFEYGNLEENSYIASCRKSILAMLYGKYVSNETIQLDKTLEQIEIEDLELLSETERKATVKDIISSRSGIFLPAANPGDMTHLAPKRGSVKPGEFWLYNNWDFNTAGYIFEKETGKNIYDDIENQFAKPIGMQDWNRKLQAKSGDITASSMLAYHMWFSTRDMARIGWLMLNNGKWNDEQLIEKKWVKDMTTPKTSFEEVDKIAPFFKDDGAFFSYGYMWWLWEKPNNEMLEGAYTASGAWGQNITIFPKLNTVLVIKTNDIYERQLGDHNYIIEEISKSYNPKDAKDLEKFAKNLANEDIDSFAKDMKKLKHDNLESDYQNIINQMGYRYKENGAIEKAMKLFKLNVELNPNSWNAHDSLGEIYFVSGDYKKSLKYYTKAVDLNKSNQYGNNDRLVHVIKRIELKLK